MHRVGGLLAPYRGRVALGFGLAAASCLLNFPVPLLIQRLIDRAIAGATVAMTVRDAAALLAVFAVQATIGWAAARTAAGVGLAVVRDLRAHLYARLQQLGISYYDRTPAGAIVARLTDDVAAVQNLVTGQSLTILTELGTALVVAAWLVVVSPRLFLVALLAGPVYALLFCFFPGRLREGTAEVRRELDGIFGRLKEKIDGVLVVKAHAREAAEADEFAAQIDAAHRPRLRVGGLAAAFTYLSQAAGGITTAAVSAAAAYEVLHGRLTPGAAVSASALAALVFGPLARLADLVAVFQQAAASVSRLGDVLDREPDLREPDCPVRLGRAWGSVEFDRVSFGYRAGQPVVWDVRLSIRPGEKVALVGPTGCGKTTLVNLLLRFYDPTWGEVRLDDVPLPRLALADLRRQISVVPQEPVVFRASLADNIRYGCPEADMARVEAAARAAYVHEFAERLPRGSATIVGEGGHRLSQGERQRVAIARAFCINPAVLVLDEATSSLDTTSEALIRAALADLLHGRTSLIIAHRLATIRDVDRIVVMDGGLVEQIGTHGELLAERGGLYQRFCARQFGRLDAGHDRADGPHGRRHSVTVGLSLVPGEPGA